MDNISIEKIYSIIGELYLNTRAKIVEVESSYSNIVAESKKLADQYNALNEEHNRLLAELAHLKMTNDRLQQ